MLSGEEKMNLTTPHLPGLRRPGRHCPMNKSRIGAALLALFAFACGTLVGRHMLSRSNPAAERRSAELESRPHSAGAVGAPATAAGGGKTNILSLEEVRAAIQTLGNRTLRQRYDAVNEMVACVAPADLPQVLAWAEKTTPGEFRTAFRDALLERWAETDVNAAMAYAEKVPGAQNRQQAMLKVLASWAQQDAASAVAWVRQLPSGPFQDHAVQTLAFALA